MIILGCACGGIGEYLIIMWILSFFGVGATAWTLKGQIHKFVHGIRNKLKGKTETKLTSEKDS